MHAVEELNVAPPAVEPVLDPVYEIHAGPEIDPVQELGACDPGRGGATEARRREVAEAGEEVRLAGEEGLDGVNDDGRIDGSSAVLLQDTEEFDVGFAAVCGGGGLYFADQSESFGKEWFHC